MHFLIEVKANGEKRFVNMFMQEAAGHNEKACLVFMALYISEESAGAMRDGKYSYMDLSGNCHILTKRIFLYVSGQANKFIVKKEKKNYLSKSSSAASAIMRTMLNVLQRQQHDMHQLCDIKKVDVYVKPQFFDEFVRDLHLQSVSSGGNVVITIPHDETPCMYAKMINGSFVTSPTQTVIDLLGNAGRGEEAADAIITKEYQEDSDD